MCAWGALMVLAWGSGPASAQVAQSEQIPSTVTEEALPAWAPNPNINLNGFDWIELNSGEWLKGEIKYMSDDELSFDSDILGDLIIDWSDVKQIKTDRTLSIRTDSRQTIKGKIMMADGEVHVSDAEVEMVTFPTFGLVSKETTAKVGSMEVKQGNVVGMVPQDKDRVLENWSINASIGANFQSGNTDETAFSVDGTVERRTAGSRLNFNFLGNYAKDNGVLNKENIRVTSFYDYFVDNELFVRIVNGEYFHDPFQNIAHRVTIGTGVGYQLYDEPDFEWDVVAGPAYQITWFDTVTTGSNAMVQTPAFLLVTNLSYDITSDLTYTGLYQFVLTGRNSGLLTTHFVNSLEYELTDIFDLKMSFIWDRVQDPTAMSDGTVPQQDDFYLIFGLGVSY